MHLKADNDIVNLRDDENLELCPSQASHGRNEILPSSLKSLGGSIVKTLSCLSIHRRNSSKVSLNSSKSIPSSASMESLNSLPEVFFGNRTEYNTHRLRCPSEERTEKETTRCHSHDNGTISYGVSQAMGNKDQDRFDIRLSSDRLHDFYYFGVFDGHGTSALAADLCVERLFDEMTKAMEVSKNDDDTKSVRSDGSESRFSLEDVPHATSRLMFHNDAIIAGHLALDDLVKAQRDNEPRAGTCSVTLMIDSNQAVFGDGPEMTCKVAWVGDCHAIMISKSGKVHDLTQDHHIDSNEKEFARIINADHSPSAGHCESEVDRKDAPDNPQLQSDLSLNRTSSFVGRRMIDGQYSGPSCVFSHTGGISLQVTRSIGDAFAARSVIANPDVNCFSIPTNESTRFVLGSDGVFECVTPEKVAKLVKKFSNPLKASNKLVAYCRHKRFYSGHGNDDITCVVVDINPNLCNFRSQ